MLIIEVVIYVFIIFSRFVEPLKYITIPVSFTGVSLILLIFLLSTSLLFFIKLKTTVETEGIRYRMKPFERKGHLTEKAAIERFYIKRKSRGKNKKRYKTGLYLELKSGKKLFIETKKPKEMIKAVNALMQK